MSVEVPQNPQAIAERNLTVNPQSQKKNDLLLIFLILLLVVTVGAGGFLLAKYQDSAKNQASISSQNSAIPSTQTPSPFREVANVPTTPTITDETANWKIYTNTKNGYSVRYPGDFKVTESSSDSVRVSNNLPPDPNCKGGGCNLEISKLSIYFEHLNNPSEDTMTLDNFANARRQALLQINNDQSQIEKIKKFGLDVRYLEGITEGYHQSYFMKPSPSSSFVISVIFPSKDDVPTYKEASDQILSTFKFLDKNEVLKTYSHRQLENISLVPLNIKYPESWKLSVFEYPNSSGFQLTLAKSSSKITITQGAMGGGGCLFPGDADQEGPYIRYNDPTTITSTNGTTWVRATYLTQNSSDPLRYTVCQCKGSTCGGITNAGGISYEVANTDTNLLPEMDEVAKSAMPQN